MSRWAEGNVPREVHRSGDLKPFTLAGWRQIDDVLVMDLTLLVDELTENVLARIAKTNSLAGTSRR